VLLDDGSVLPFVDGRCTHLGDTGKCGIYETRPKGCRNFDCSREPSYLRAHQRVEALLTLHGVPFMESEPG